jgi:arsenite methyltransferase
MLVVQRGAYGYDAPYALATFAGLSIASALAAVTFWFRGSSRVAAQLTFYFLFFSANAASFLYTTRRGKFEEWRGILDGLDLSGGERVLDMGCGRGAVLTAVASRLTTGHASGIDIWSAHDQSGNARSVTIHNAALEDVTDRVDVQTGDMRQVPFPDATFDLVVSSLAIHNIKSMDGRRQAISEAFRVLKPGGRMVIADIRSTAAYADRLRRVGASNVLRRRLGWRFWWGNPFAGTTLVTASKP